MPITVNKTAFVDPTAASIGLSQMFTVTAGTANPTYLVLSVLDRNEYTAHATGATGSLTGNGHVLNLSGLGSDGRGAGIVFTYQASTGRYYSSTYGYFDQLTYNSSGSLDDVANLSLFGTNNLNLANSYATNTYSMTQVDASGYLGSATVATEPSFGGIVPMQATPNSIAAVANTFVGDSWNMNGCWVLASTIAAEAGASLPVQSTEIGLSGQANGEWIVAFNGPASQAGNWQSLVKAGEIIVIGTAGGGGHITTCVSGSGSTAMLVDNITYENSNGQITNLAGDGSSSDILISAPHIASQEWAGVQGSSVVIYELDTPIVACSVATDNLTIHASQLLATLFTATDPTNKTITEWQVYDTATSDFLVLNGANNSDHSASAALTVASLSAVSLLAGATTGTDTLEARAFNGSYWGDWQSLNVAIVSTVPSPPVLATQTPNQTWTGGKAVGLTLPAATFVDPQGETLTYSALLSNGQALPAWLTFNGATDTFSGTAPTAPQTLKITVSARDTSNLTISDTFSVTVVGAPVNAAQTPNQSWTEGKAISLALPVNTFTDPQGGSLTYTATLSSGQALPSWLTFNAKTEAFSGTAPATAQSLSIKVTATDSLGLSASESFTATVAAAPPPKPSIAVSNQTPNQVWIDGQAVSLVLPASTFTDALGLKMTFAAYEVSGPSETSWLRFNAATDQLYGTVPTNATGTINVAIVAADAQNATASDLFSITFVASGGHATTGVTPGSLGLTLPSALSTMLGSIGLHN